MYCLLTYPLAKRVYGIQLWGTGEICKTVKVIRDNINKTNEMSLKTKSSANSAQLRSLWSEMPDMRLAMTAYFKKLCSTDKYPKCKICSSYDKQALWV